MNYPPSVQHLIRELCKLPGVGPRTATRYAFYLLRQPEAEIRLLSQSLQNLKQKTNICHNCFNIAEKHLCEFCSNPKRDRSIICVVEEASTIPTIETTGKFNGLYFVLGGTVKPNTNKETTNLNIPMLLKRIQKSEVREVILATNPNIEGEITTSYVLKQIKHLPLKITRLARGLSTGSELEYADALTITHALEERKEF